MTDPIRARVRKVLIQTVADALDDRRDDVDTATLDDLGLDSLDHVELLINLEAEFRLDDAIPTPMGSDTLTTLTQTITRVRHVAGVDHG